MVTAIGLSSSSHNPAGTRTAALEAQIARYQKALAECVNCSSSKTPEGKKTIEDISNKISAAKARIDEIQTTRPVTRPTEVSAPTSAYSTTGSLIDVFG